jgi:uncharacterized protein (DUF362 family)
MDRRNFIKHLAVFSAISPLAARAGFAFDSTTEQELFPDVVKINGESPSANTRLAIEALGGMKRFVKPQDVVLIKPNIGWDRRPDQAANTNPEVVSVLVTMCLDAGAKQVKVMDNTCNNARRCYKRSGIKEAAEKAGAIVKHVDDRNLVEMRIDGEVLKKWKVYKDFTEVDKLINVPVAKQHGLAGLSLGMKNWIGAVGGRRNALHQKMNQSIVDLAAFFTPALTVVDGHRVIVRNGPQGGSPGDVLQKNTLVAGTDPVAVDTYGAAILEKAPQEVSYLSMAASRGLGNVLKSRMRFREIEAT